MIDWSILDGCFQEESYQKVSRPCMNLCSKFATCLLSGRSTSPPQLMVARWRWITWLRWSTWSRSSKRQQVILMIAVGANSANCVRSGCVAAVSGGRPVSAWEQTRKRVKTIKRIGTDKICRKLKIRWIHLSKIFSTRSIITVGRNNVEISATCSELPLRSTSKSDGSWHYPLRPSWNFSAL